MLYNRRCLVRTYYGGIQVEKKWIAKVPIFMFSALVPLIMRAKYIELSDEMFLIYNGARKHVDFYSYNKMVMIVISLILALAIFIKYKKNKRELIKPIINKLLLIFALLIIVSSVLSKYQFITYFGMVDRYEGMMVQLAYIFFVFYINSFVDNYRDVKIILMGIVCSSTIVGLIGFFEFFGMNPFNTALGKSLILPASLSHMADKVVFSIKGGGISTTLYNPNFVGSYMNLTFFIGLSLLFLAKKPLAQILWFVYTFLMLFNLIGCGSAAGKVAFLAGVLAIVFFYRSKLLSIKGIYLAFYVSIFLILPGLLNLGSSISGELINYSTSLDEGKIDERMIDKNFDIALEKGKFSLDYTDANDEVSNLSVLINDDKLIIELNGDRMDEIEINPESKEVNFGDEFIDKNFVVSLAQGNNAVYLSYRDKFSVVLRITENGFLLQDPFARTIERYGGFEEFKPLIGKEFIGSSRGYIWKMSIPLMKNNILIGSGADTMGAVFPQTDLVGKFKYIRNAYGYIDKPHNMYIQTGIQTGLVSLLVYFSILIIYGVETIIYYLKDDFTRDIYIVGFGIFLSVFTYSIAGLFNDSNVSVGPLYWTILGLGLTVNMMIKNNKIVNAGE